METYPDSVTQVFNLPRAAAAAAAAAGLMLRMKKYAFFSFFFWCWTQQAPSQQHCVLFLWLTSFWNNESESEPCCIIVQVKTCLQLYCGYLLTPHDPSQHGFRLEIQPFAVSISPPRLVAFMFLFHPKFHKKQMKNKSLQKGLPCPLRMWNLWCPPVMFLLQI